jgi:hypothetical protein
LRWRVAIAELLALQMEYGAWLEALPQPLRDDAIGEALQAIVDIDLDELIAIEPPRGFGRYSAHLCTHLLGGVWHFDSPCDWVLHGQHMV